MKKIFLFFLFFVVLSLVGGVLFSRFEKNDKQYISRYDLAEGLSEATCQDCVLPPVSWREKYTSSWLADVEKKQLYNIEDITFTGTIYEGEDYFSCVARGVDKGYMYGFPRSTSPFCRGMFCGAHLARYSEVVEGLYHVVAPYIYQKYSLNWFDVGNRMQENKQDIPISWFGIAKKGLEHCGKEACVLNNKEELEVYTTYCAVHDCNLPYYSVFPEKTRLSVLFALLVKADIIDAKEAQAYTMQSFLEPAVFLKYIGNTTKIVHCERDDDYDRDGIGNHDDNCPYVWNPHQYDVDQDGEGNVCDDDIDNDGVSNPVGFVDDENIIIPRLYGDNEDNCPLLTNSDQDNICSTTSGNALALALESDVSFGTSPLNVSFSQKYYGDVDTVVRDFGDGTSFVGFDPSYTYTHIGHYTVKAKAWMSNGEIIVAKLPVEVLPGADLQVGCAGQVDKLFGYVGEPFTFSQEYTGEIDKVMWSLDGELVTVAPDEAVQRSFQNSGQHRVEMQCYNVRGEWVGISAFRVETMTPGFGQEEDLKGSFLTTSSLSSSVYQTFTLDTQYHGFIPSDIKNVSWDFGDGDTRNGVDLSVEKAYTQPGAYIIRQVIDLYGSTLSLENILNVYIQDDSVGQSTSLTGSSLTGNIGSPFDFAVDLKNISGNEVHVLQRDCGEGKIQNIRENIEQYLDHTCVYTTPGSHRVKAYVYTNKGVFINEMTVYAMGEALCSTNMQSLHCDLDEDGLPDLCDDDIDGDRKINWLGLLKYELDDCSFGDNIDINKNTAYHETCKAGADFDNCPFVVNKDQKDDTKNGWGNVCDTGGEGSGNGNNNGNGGSNGDGGGTGGGEKDSDGDGIPDESDACAGVPESNNGSEDSDGCPEFPDPDDDKESKNPFIKVENCTSCPCPYADYASSLWKGDKVRALLLDPGETVVYRYTKPEVIKEDILEQMGE